MRNSIAKIEVSIKVDSIMHINHSAVLDLCAFVFSNNKKIKTYQ